MNCCVCNLKLTDRDRELERVVRIGPELERHTSCAPGSKAWMNSPASKNSKVKQYFKEAEKEERMAKKVTDDQLQKLAEEMNKVMTLKPPMDAKLDRSELLSQIKAEAEAPGEDGLRHDDKFSDEAKLHFINLGIAVPEEWTEAINGGSASSDEGKEETIVPKKTAPKKAAKKVAAKKATPKKAATPKYPREHSVVDALTKKATTKEELAKKANDLYVKNGGTDNTKQSLHVLNIGIKFLEHAGVVKVSDDKVTKV